MRPIRLTSLLISRFLLNLQAVEQKSTDIASSTGSRFESVVFQRVIGSLDCDIEFGENIDLDDFEEERTAREDGGVGDAENSLSGPEHTKEGAAEVVALDD